MGRQSEQSDCQWSIGCSDEYEIASVARRWDPDVPSGSLATSVRSLRSKYTARKGPKLLHFVTTVKPPRYKAACDLTMTQRASRDYWRAWANRPRKGA